MGIMNIIVNMNAINMNIFVNLNTINTIFNMNIIGAKWVL